MTDNFDEFDPDQFDASEIDSGMDRGQKKQNAIKAMMGKPVVKLGLIVGVVGLAIAGALGAFSGGKEITSSRMVQPPALNEAPGGQVTPFFKEQNDLADAQRVQEAFEGQGSAMPTPIGKSVNDVNLNALAKQNAMQEFNAQTERLKQEFRAEQRQNEQKMQALQQQMKQRAPEDDTLAKAMQTQMQQLMESWSPLKIKVVTGTEPVSTTSQTDVTTGPRDAQNALINAESVQKVAKTIVPAGTVNYAQLLTEANSDVPGPIMVQILSGPLKGGRAIGQFKVMYEQLVLTFSLAILKGKEYQINAIALDPDTTLGGMATDVDHRYFKRILLPAAASFVSEFGSALSSAGSQTTVTGDSIVVNEVEKGYKEAAFEGMAKAGDVVARFLEQEAAQTKTLVRVTAGAAMGMFFLSSVKDQEFSDSSVANMPEGGLPAARTNTPEGGLPEAMARAYQQSGYGVPNVSSYPRASYSAAPAGPTSGGIKTPGGTVTIYK